MQPTYNNEGVKIFNGDVLEVLDQLRGETKAELIFIDPPYNIGKKFGKEKFKFSRSEYLSWCKQWLEVCLEILSPTGTLYFMCATQFSADFDIYLQSKLSILSRIVWCYDSSGVQAKRFYGSLYEPIFHCVKDPKRYTFNSNDILVEAKTGSKRKLIDYRKSPPQPYNTKKVPGNVWNMPRVRYRMPEYVDHPSQKPEALMERIIKASSNPGDLILDPFGGSFTTAVVAKRLRAC